MDALISTSQEETLRDSQMPIEATHNPIDAVMKELADLRKGNQKLNDRLDSVLHLKAKKSLFNERKHTPVDPNCSVSIICKDFSLYEAAGIFITLCAWSSSI